MELGVEIVVESLRLRYTMSVFPEQTEWDITVQDVTKVGDPNEPHCV